MPCRYGCAIADDRVRAAANAAMARYVAGDDRAFAVLHELIAPRLYAFLLRRTRDEARAEDLLQHVFLKMHAARSHFYQGAEVLPWAFVITRRLLIDRFREQGRERLMSAEDELRVCCRPAPESKLEEIISHRRLVHRVELELANLPESHRVAFVLVRLEGLTVAEAAHALGTTVDAVKTRTHRACAALRERLGAAALEGL
jgi:RNA polymerase sigma-70 factor (ECF subfamily)